MAFGAQALAAALDRLDPGWRRERLCVAFSGGLDSLALLDALAGLARPAGTALRALHVDHGLHPHSADWAAACVEAGRARGLTVAVVRLALVPAPGASLEAEARAARHAAFAAQLGDGERILTAHHGDDQLETVLIQLLRGAGLPGLAAMPGRAPLGRGIHLRPLLEFGRAELEAYAHAAGFGWVEDPMNGDLRLDRGYLRRRVMPALLARWPSARVTVARSSRHAAEGARLLAELAAQDAQAIVQDGRIELAALTGLPPGRQTNLVRAWLRAQGLSVPSTARLERGLRDLRQARPDGAPQLAWPGAEIRRYRGRLYASPTLAEPSPPPPPGSRTWTLGPGLGCFELVAGQGDGLCAARAAGAVLTRRAGGEGLKPHPGRPRKRLKDLCQEAGVVPWMRNRLPLVTVGGRLAAVGDLWIDADFAAAAGAPALRPVWSGRPPLY